MFLFFTASRPALGPTQPTIQQALGALYPGVKWPGHEADHSLASNTEMKKQSYTSTPPCHHGMVFNYLAQGELFTFTGPMQHLHVKFKFNYWLSSKWIAT
jgi:hypothetical protein